MTEKQASSEIAEDQERARNLMRELALPDDQAVVDLIADVLKIWRESWERDTRERCAQIAEGIAGTEPDGVFEAGYDCGARMAARAHSREGVSRYIVKSLCRGGIDHLSPR